MFQNSITTQQTCTIKVLNVFHFYWKNLAKQILLAQMWIILLSEILQLINNLKYWYILCIHISASQLIAVHCLPHKILYCTQMIGNCLLPKILLFSHKLYSDMTFYNDFIFYGISKCLYFILYLRSKMKKMWMGLWDP